MNEVIGRLMFGVILILSQTVMAEEAVEVTAWARATPPGGTSGAIYGEFRNPGGQPATVKEVMFELAHHVMVHKTSHEDGMARMQHGQLQIAAGESVTLAPGGLHIMLMGLSKRLKAGCEYPFKILWADGTVSRHQFLTGGFGQMEPPIDVSEQDCP